MRSYRGYASPSVTLKEAAGAFVFRGDASLLEFGQAGGILWTERGVCVHACVGDGPRSFERTSTHKRTTHRAHIAYRIAQRTLFAGIARPAYLGRFR